MQNYDKHKRIGISTKKTMTNQPKQTTPKRLQPHRAQSALLTIESAPSQQSATETVNSQTPLERYQSITHELARTMLAKEQIEARERELLTAQILAKNACIMSGIENPAAAPAPTDSGQSFFESDQVDRTKIARRSAI